MQGGSRTLCRRDRRYALADATLSFELSAGHASRGYGRSADQVEQFTIQTLLSTPAVRVTDVVCSGTCRHKSDEECATETHLVFPYRGVYVRHIGRDDAVA